ncbi:hypothetical protein QQS21_005322 [Conoideocrella luteorostrata]|uniref:Beta-lactamase-related domain-containing protein n=1 Tax=Conoideocrella luteorostrata TaxID=1105319 RepID=A0AAJ0FTX1_9HYPO|nr:hypothetical protein QQS21_005322 [Conoideocrella luteorostrata]
MLRIWRMVAAAALVAALQTDGHSQNAQTPLGAATLNDTKSNNPFTAELGVFIETVLRSWKVPGLSIAVIDGDDVFTEGFGFASFPDTAATPETLYYVGSNSKAHTAAALAQLIDSRAAPELLRGWNTPISSIIRDDFILQDEWATAHVTLDDAVSHRTGLPGHDVSWHREINGTATTLRDVVRNLRNLPMNLEPRVEWHYCNLMYVSLSHVIETVTGKWLGDVLRELIWDPLGMKTTYMDLQDAKKAPVDLAKSYLWVEEDQKYKEMPFFDAVTASGAGGIISTVVDFAKWVQCLVHETAPFSKAAHRDIRTPRFNVQPGPDDIALYGLGWMRTTFHGAVAYWHDGSTRTYGSLVYWFPDLKYGVVVFANGARTSNYAEEIIVQKIMADKLEVPDSDREDVDKKYRQVEEKMERDLKNATEILFPNRARNPQPPTVSVGALEGVYRSQGHGTFRLFEERHPHHANKTALVANRPELLFDHQLRLEHASGDYWTIYAEQADGADNVYFFAGQFEIGVDGKVAGLKIDFHSRGMHEGTVLFSKIE